MPKLKTIGLWGLLPLNATVKWMCAALGQFLFKSSKILAKHSLGHYAPFWSPLQPLSHHRPRGAQKDKEATQCWTSWSALNKGRLNQPATLLRASRHLMLQRPPCRRVVTFKVEFCEFEWSEVRRKVSIGFWPEKHFYTSTKYSKRSRIPTLWGFVF